MAVFAKVELHGVAEVLRKLEGLKQGARNRIARPALTKAARVVAKEAKRRAPKDTGALKRSLTAVIRASRRTGRVYALIGPATETQRDKKTGEKVKSAFGKWLEKRGLKNKPAWTAHFSELGTVREPPRPWLKPALLSQRSEVSAIIRREILVGLAKYHERKRRQ